MNNLSETEYGSVTNVGLKNNNFFKFI